MLFNNSTMHWTHVFEASQPRLVQNVSRHRSQTASGLPEESGVGRQSCDGDAHVTVHMQDLLLMGGQLRLSSLQTHRAFRAMLYC